jgi:hypothetical protein
MVASPLSRGHRSVIGDRHLRRCAVAQIENGLQATRWCKKTLLGCAYSPGARWGTWEELRLSELNVIARILMILYEREQPDSPYSELPFSINSTWHISSVRRFFWTSYWGSRCRPSMATCKSPARSSGWLQKTKRIREGLGWVRVPRVSWQSSQNIYRAGGWSAPTSQRRRWSGSGGTKVHVLGANLFELDWQRTRRGLGRLCGGQRLRRRS